MVPTRIAADLLGLDMGTVRRLRRQGRLPAAGKLPAGWVYHRRDVERLRAERKGRSVGKRREFWRVEPSRPKAREAPYWRLRVYPPTGSGERPSRCRLDLAVADDPDGVRAAELAAARQAELNATLAPPGTVLGVYDRWVASTERGESAERTVRAAREAIAAAIEDPAARELDRAAVLRLQDALLEQVSPATGKPRSAATCALYVAQLKAAWRWAHARGYVEKGWPSLGRREVLRGAPTERRPYTPREAAELLDHLERTEPTWWPIFALLADSGRRAGEVLGATVGDVGGHREAPWVEVRNAKRGGRRERAYFLPDLLPLLDLDRPANAPLFPGPRRGKRIRVNTLNTVLRRALARLGWEDRPLDVHSFRRYRVAEAVQPGESHAQGMRITGHASHRVFLDYQRNAEDPGIHEHLRRSRARRPEVGRVARSDAGVTPGHADGEHMLGRDLEPRASCCRSLLPDDNSPGPKTLATPSPATLSVLTAQLRAIARRLLRLGGADVAP